MDSSSPFKPITAQKRPPVGKTSDSFVEALKDTANQNRDTAYSSPFDALARQRQQLEQERRLRLEQQQAFEKRRRQEFLVFSQKEEQSKHEIKALQQQLIKLIEDTQGLTQEVEIAVTQQVVDPGTYHVNFFDRLRQFIQLMRKKIQDSSSWLSTFNSRAKRQQGLYWAQVQKSGTKFMLSQERSMVTQTG